MMKRRWPLALFLFVCAFQMDAQIPTASPAPSAPLFDTHRFNPNAFPPAPSEESPPATPPTEPLPRGVIVGAILFALAGIAALGVISLRAWQAHNLFDRRYHFPVDPAPKLRLGATKCGGKMATARFQSKREESKKSDFER